MSRLCLLLLLVSPAAVRASDIIGYVPGSPISIATYDRFPNGIGSPTPNTSGSFVGAGLDLSGIGWITGGEGSAVTLFAAQSIANPSQVVGQYIVGAAHVPLGSSVTFADNTGATHTYSVSNTLRLTTGGTGSDVIIGRLSAPVPTAAGITPLPLANLTATTAIGVEAYAYGLNAAYGADRRQLGLATIGEVAQVSFEQPPDTGPSPTVVALWDQDPNRPGSSALIGGDSGGPLFTRGVNGETALIGAHFGAGTDPVTGARISASSFLPNPEYVQQINDFLQPDGFRVLLVPVPEPTGLIAVAGVLLVASRRLRAVRRRRVT